MHCPLDLFLLLVQIGFYDRDYLSGCVNNEGGFFLSQTMYQTVSQSSVDVLLLEILLH